MFNVECLMWKEKNFMKTTKQNKMNHWTLIVGLFLMLSAVHVQAVEYKNTYGGNYRPIGSSYQATVPSVSFQSTSAYAAPEWAEEPMLNADGSVNLDAYEVSSNSSTRGIHRVEQNINNPGDPEDDGDDDGNVPLGDALIPLTLLAIAYCGWRFLLRRKEA